MADDFLQSHIRSAATETHCSYCAATSDTPFAVTHVEFVAALMVGVGVYYQQQTASGEAVAAREVAVDILAIAGVSDPALVEDVVTSLSVTPGWMHRDHRSGNRIEQLTYSWEAFKHIVKHEMRYFFSTQPTGDEMTAGQVLKAVSDLGERHPAVWPAPCPSPLFRARMATSHGEASSWQHASEIGPPPPEWAAANRMSPAGISIFYGATDRVTAIAEAGAHAAFRYVTTAEFTPTREIRLIDLTNLPEPPSIFDASAHQEFFVLRFLKMFIHDITLPVELDGHEHIDYVPTQVFTEYFRYAFPGRVDGLMFPSAQGPGNNVAVFVGPDLCADAGAEDERTTLVMDQGTLQVSRVMTVAR
ncbi:RES domain-containing protein [Mycobacterium sp. C31M]